VHTYGDYEGDVFEYKACQTSEDDKKWMKTGSNRKMNLKEWNTWFQNEQKKPIEREYLYITGISLSSADVDCLRENRLINAFASCGQLDLTNYILKYVQ
jgi:adenine C2-methylase RlmN of 23S rRNA A2503 and tRNA A37